MSVPGVSESGGDTPREVAELLRAYQAALLGRDCEALESILADDYVFIEPTGAVVSKSELVSQVRSGALVYESIEVAESTVRIYGETAVLTDRSMTKGNYEGFEFGGEYRGTDVCVKRSGRWQCVHTQETAIRRQ